MGRELGAPEGLCLLCGGGRTPSPGTQQSYNRHSPGPGSARIGWSTWAHSALSLQALAPLYGSVDAETQRGTEHPLGPHSEARGELG